MLVASHPVLRLGGRLSRWLGLAAATFLILASPCEGQSFKVTLMSPAVDESFASLSDISFTATITSKRALRLVRLILKTPSGVNLSFDDVMEATSPDLYTGSVNGLEDEVGQWSFQVRAWNDASRMRSSGWRSFHLETTNQPALTFTYQADESNFANPERGFYGSYNLMTETYLGWIRADNKSLAFAYIRLDDYRDQSIASSVLDQIDTSLGLARDVGLKVIVRCTYNFPSGADYLTSQDASLAQVLLHVDQLKAVFEANQDVILLHQAGFVGAWGEWHSSSNGLTEPAARHSILEALWSSVGLNRMVQLRYPRHIIDEFPVPLQAGQAFDLSPQARTGHHNDCFLSSPNDVGTYQPVADMPAQQTYIEAIAPYVFVGGETCNAGNYERRYDCPAATSELERFQWDYININYNVEAINTWKAQGCYDEIAKKLGYRYRLLSTDVLVQGSAMNVDIELANDGWSGVKNPRGINLVMRRQGDSAEYKLCVDCQNGTIDVRTWFPAAGQSKILNILWNLPNEIAAGAAGTSYDLFLELPDPLLSVRPEYSIRLANAGVWEETTGFNKLGSLQVP